MVCLKCEWLCAVVRAACVNPIFGNSHLGAISLKQKCLQAGEQHNNAKLTAELNIQAVSPQVMLSDLWISHEVYATCYHLVHTCRTRQYTQRMRTRFTRGGHRCTLLGSTCLETSTDHHDILQAHLEITCKCAQISSIQDMLQFIALPWGWASPGLTL